MSILKPNPTSTNSSETTTPRHNRRPKSGDRHHHHHHQSRAVAPPPPDVLNVNQIQKIAGGDFTQQQQQQFLMGVENGDDGSFVNVSLNEMVSSNNSNGSTEEFEFNKEEEGAAAMERNRNEWRDEGGASEQLPR